MNTVQLTAIMDKILCNTHFLGVLPSDQLPERPLRNLPSMSISNTHSSNLPGEHWIAVYLTQDSSGCFSDSYGNAPDSERFPISIKKCLISNVPVMLYFTKRVQDFTSDVCGQHSVFFLYHLARGRDYNYVMNLYSDDYIKNYKMVSLFVKRLRSNACNEKCFCVLIACRHVIPLCCMIELSIVCV